MNKKKLKELRNRKGLTLDQLAEQSGVSKRAIQNYESKEYTHSPNADKLRDLCRILCPENPQKAWDEVMDFPDSVREDTVSSDSSDAGDVREDTVSSDSSDAGDVREDTVSSDSSDAGDVCEDTVSSDSSDAGDVREDTVSSDSSDAGDVCEDTVFGDKGDAVSTSEDIICEEGLNEDYSYEKTLLERCADKMPAGLNGALVVLLDPESTNSVMGAIAGMCGYLRISSGSPAVCGATFEFLSSFATVIQKAMLTENPEQLERFTRAIIADISELVSGGGIPDSIAVNLKNAVGVLISSRGSNCPEERLNASRAAFFALYDAWNHINRVPRSYTMLSHFTMLFDETEDTPELRRRVFYAVINHFEEVEVAERAISCANIKPKIVSESPR